MSKDEQRATGIEGRAEDSETYEREDVIEDAIEVYVRGRAIRE